MMDIFEIKANEGFVRKFNTQNVDDRHIIIMKQFTIKSGDGYFRGHWLLIVRSLFISKYSIQNHSFYTWELIVFEEYDSEVFIKII